MYTIEFYENNKGQSELWDFFENLRLKAQNSKDARIFYFFYRDNIFVLLHVFRKKTQKTPLREIEKAKAERSDYLARKGIEMNENMG